MLATDRDQMLLERLNRHPTLRARMESLLGVVEDAAGDLEKADAAERRVIEELRQMGNEALAAWAERGVEKSVAVARVEPDLRLAGKKNSIGTRPSVKSMW
ncbi:MAG: hypothetical protein AW09_004065 [Candidatus Accumulibacter phosphatis]|uniref:Uncharacterized protein n=1 Tax=Candidatus Accumulibacter phosphatis TaxID=327160 RepID=A0A080LTA4_9PROT|nr:MAG: hypothetical protein AW09_004065 [Candidatus Accumulibacter phosphatis]